MQTTTSAGRIGVLVMAHGTPATFDELEAFYTSIRHGRAPTVELLDGLRSRYDAIGGTSPLAQRTAAQVEGIRNELELASPGRYVVEFGAKHTEPSIEAGAAALAVAGVGVVVGLVLTPHPCSVGSGEYLARAAAALQGVAPSPRFVPVDGWYTSEDFVALVGARVRASLGSPSGNGDGRRVVLFTAHSVPRRVVDAGDRYPEHVRSSAALVAREASIAADWQVAWQSAGRTSEPWVGPDLLATLRSLPSLGFTAVHVCPIGFVADHLEVLYDLDIEARAVAGEVGLSFARTESLNDDARFLRLLADEVRAAAGEVHVVTKRTVSLQ